MIDERNGRREAVARGLSIIGVVGLLEVAAARGLIQNLAAAHDALRNIHFHVSDAMLAQSFARHEARRKS